jgi:hypothetical protein
MILVNITIVIGYTLLTGEILALYTKILVFGNKLKIEVFITDIQSTEGTLK